MGIGISNTAAELWLAYDPDSYNEYFVETEGEYSFFTDLPDWAYTADVGPFYIGNDGAIYAISLRPSQNGKMIGNLI